MYKRILFTVALSAGFLSTQAVSLAQPTPPHWGYAGAEAPDHWSKLGPAYSLCSLGKMQSPIDIVQPKPANLPALKFAYRSEPLSIIDNEHSIQINYPKGSTLKVGDRTYNFIQFHFHTPSDEHVNGKASPLASHLVYSDAADGHAVVVAVLFAIGAANPLIDKLWQNIPAHKEEAKNVPDVSINAEGLLPADRGYFTYTGSLTTPPCSEGVTWYILQNHPTISTAQLATFRKIYPMNSRPLQPVNNREVLQSR